MAIPESSRGLCEVLALEAPLSPPELREHLRQARLAVQEAARHDEFLDLPLADSIAGVIETLLSDETLPRRPDHHRAVHVAVRYLAHCDDAEPDLDSVLGFEDDVAVLNAVLRFIGREDPIRGAYARRQALVKLAALGALALSISVGDLVTACRVQFPVLHPYERESFYDRRGHIVFPVNRGLPGVGLDRNAWEQVKNAKAGDMLPDFAAEYVPPFDRRDREADMRQACAFFAPLLEGRPAGS